MKNKPSTRSMARLQGVHPVLSAVVMLSMSMSEVDFFVAEGVRTKEKQEEYIKRGVSWKMKSKHLQQSDGYAHAVDLYPTTNKNIPDIPPIDYHAVASYMKEAAHMMGVEIEWGYDLWEKDMPHFQLRSY